MTHRENNAMETSTPSHATRSGRSAESSSPRSRIGVIQAALSLSALLVMLSLAPSGRAHTGEDILSLGVTNYSGYVIDSDGNFPSSVYDRDAIRASAQVRFSTSGNITSTYEYQMQFRLLDSSSNAVPLRVGLTTSTSILVTDEVTLPFVLLGTSVQNVTRTYGAALRPAVKLAAS